ncbi:MAG: carboxypeptidase regulatory-like domain-containing protein [Armatimonadetes bacterium]|nr:carboxypeptidase regulatory-like domain-containing protein [Armatimonadota bacterium]
MKRIGFAVIGAWAILGVAQDSSLTVTGQVNLPDGSPAKEAVVFLQGATKAKPMRNAVIDQRDKRFAPRVLVVTTGTTVEFPNNDTVFHNVFAYYNAKKFDLGMYAKGKTKSQTFDKPGVVALLCNVHSGMSAYIYIVDTPYFAVTDSKGRYEIKGVPAGQYNLIAWHEAGHTSERKVTLHKDGDLTYPIRLKK